MQLRNISKIWELPTYYIRFISERSIIHSTCISKREMSSSMKAVRIHSTGDPTVLTVEKVPIPEISSKQVLVRIHAAGLNPVDTYIRERKFNYDPKLPAILGGEAAGEIVKCGSQVDGKLKAGDRVICCLRPPHYGGYAEFTPCDAEDIIPLSEKLTYSQGAAIYIAYFTAYRALVTSCKLKPNELVMVHGASGGVGVAAVQIAKAHGAIVAASAGSDKGLNLLKTISADIVVDHREDGHLEKALSAAKRPGFDVIVENRADLNLAKDLVALGTEGRIGVVGSRGAIEVDPRNFIRTEGSVCGVSLQKITREEFTKYSSALVAGMEKGWLNPVVGKEYKMDEIQDAHRDLIKAHGAYGKSVIKII